MRYKIEVGKGNRAVVLRVGERIALKLDLEAGDCQFWQNC